MWIHQGILEEILSKIRDELVIEYCHQAKNLIILGTQTKAGPLATVQINHHGEWQTTSKLWQQQELWMTMKKWKPHKNIPLNIATIA